MLVLLTFGHGLAQTLVGKWDMDVADLKVSNLSSTTLEFTQSGVVKLTSVFTVDAQDFSVDFILVMDGKYEAMGKALCREINPNSVKSLWEIRCPECNANDLKTVREALAPKMKDALTELVKMLKTEFTSRGMYQQILQLNEKTLVIQVPGGSLEVYNRISE